MKTIKEILEEYRDGQHGQSELRVVAEFVLDATEDEGPEWAFQMCDSLAEAAKTIKESLVKSLR